MELTSVVQRAIYLASQGYYVFPCGRNKRPLTDHAHLDATRDVEQIATWWGEHPQAYIGVHTGRSNIVVLDIDVHDDKDGFAELELKMFDIPFTYAYETPSGGRHIWFAAPHAVSLPPAMNYRKLPGIDRKSGSSYVIHYPGDFGDIELAAAPQWLLDVKERRTTGDAFEGGVDDWLNSLTDGEPDNRVLNAIERIPDGDFSHPEMVTRQFEFIRLGTEGAIGVRHGLDILRSEWLRPPYDTEDHAYEFDAALETGIKRHGAELDRIRSLPTYLDCLDMIGSQATDMLLGEPKPKKHYFDTIKVLVAQPGLSDRHIVSMIWHAPTTRQHAREWGIDYLYLEVQKAQDRHEAPIENPALELDEDGNERLDLSLLSDAERKQIEAYPTFLDRYLDWASQKVNVLNRPYHIQNGLTILSLCFGGRIFVSLSARNMGVNLFQLGLGESSTGKSESISLRDQPLRLFFGADPEYNMGSNPSPEALHAALLQRDAKVSFFNTDEAAAPLTEFLEKSYAAGLTDRLTSYYEGYVPPMLRRNDSSTTKSAITSFNIGMFGTPDKVTNIITSDQFEAGFMARFLFEIGDPSVDDPNQFDETQSRERGRTETDPAAADIAAALAYTAGLFEDRTPVFATEAALARLKQNRKAMTEALQSDPNWKMLNPTVRRLGDSLRKIATLLAVEAGCEEVGVRHVLRAIALAERYLLNARTVASMVTSSMWAKECDLIENFVTAQGGSVSAARLFNRFRNTETRIITAQVDSLVMQGRLKRTEATKERGDWYSLNTGTAAAA